MSNQAKRLEAVEKALALLLQKARYYILVRADDTPEEATKWHVEQGWLDLAEQEPIFIMSKIPGKIRRVKRVDNRDLPEAPLRKEPESAPLPPHEAYEIEPVTPKPIP